MSIKCHLLKISHGAAAIFALSSTNESFSFVSGHIDPLFVDQTSSLSDRFLAFASANFTQNHRHSLKFVTPDSSHADSWSGPLGITV